MAVAGPKFLRGREPTPEQRYQAAAARMHPELRKLRGQWMSMSPEMHPFLSAFGLRVIEVQDEADVGEGS